MEWPWECTMVSFAWASWHGLMIDRGQSDPFGRKVRAGLVGLVAWNTSESGFDEDTTLPHDNETEQTILISIPSAMCLARSNATKPALILCSHSNKTTSKRDSVWIRMNSRHNKQIASSARTQSIHMENAQSHRKYSKQHAVSEPVFGLIYAFDVCCICK